jgi:EAL domain-containing protein (putative c-di-GMP-specific phosphodiesterase class I)
MDPQRALKIAEKISDIGLRMSLDDFGTGYSSLSHLSRFPINEIKIDKSFVLNMTKRASDATIVRSTLYLAHNLGLQVVAEGIEDADVLSDLSKLQCEFGQGFLIGRPMSSGEVNNLLRNQQERVRKEILLPGGHL